MNLKVGDKVKFLNASGGGIVTKVIDSRMVSIMVEEGFEIPTLSSELILIDPHDAGSRFFAGTFDVNMPNGVTQPEEETDDQQQTLPESITRSRKTEDIFLAFVPRDQKWFITGLLDIYLINNTSYDVLYNILSRTHTGHFTGLDYGSLFPDTKVLLTTINREQLNSWTQGFIQFLFHKEQMKLLIPPFNSEFVIEGKRFYKEGSYRENPIIQAKGIVLRIISLSGYLLEITRPPSEKADPVMDKKDSPDSILTRHMVTPREAEIDLHIHELVEDPTNMEKSEILEFQKNYFLRCMDAAMTQNLLKLTFIHGVGNGILKTLIHDHLKNQKDIEYFDAPLAKYGVGAIEIRIPHNKMTIE